MGAHSSALYDLQVMLGYRDDIGSECYVITLGYVEHRTLSRIGM